MMRQKKIFFQTFPSSRGIKVSEQKVLPPLRFLAQLQHRKRRFDIESAQKGEVSTLSHLFGIYLIPQKFTIEKNKSK